LKKVKLDISKSRTIHELQQDFTNCYNFLKLEFYKPMEAGASVRLRERIPHSALLRSAGLKDNGYVEINDEMTVGDLEKRLFEQFGLSVQVSRNSGGIWLETTMTDNWSLQKQNDYGREIRQTPKRNITQQDELY
jgi:hypothetical protein